MSDTASPDLLGDDVPIVPRKKRNKKKNNEKITKYEKSTTMIEAPSIISGADGSTVKEAHQSQVNKKTGVSNHQDSPHGKPVQTNGNTEFSPSTGHSENDVTGYSKLSIPESSIPDELDSSMRLKSMSEERETLLLEVERLRKSLEDVQDRHISELNIINNKHSSEISSIEAKHAEEISTIQHKHNQELTTIRTTLEETDTAKHTAETQYLHLLERVNTIKSSLGERFKADKQELAEAKEQIESLTSENEVYGDRVKELMKEIERLDTEQRKNLEEIASLRSRYNLSQQNWSQEREGLIALKGQLKEEAEVAKEAMSDWEMLAMEERSMREGLAERTKDLEDQISSQKEALESAVLENKNQSRALEGLRRALQDMQNSRKRELREMVESYEDQLQALKKLVQESDARAMDADSTRSTLQAELDRLGPFEKEIKEKNLLIGKLRHEAIVLNDHLTKALRFLKKAKPEDNIDRQIVTNHILHFLALDRSDPKKFQILQLMASLLNWTEEQKEQAGLARPGTSNSIRPANTTFYRTPRTPSLSSDFFKDGPARKESLTELWNSFLERSAEEGSMHSRNGSINSVSAPKSEV